MRVIDLIARKRDGGALTRDEIDALVAGVTDGTIPDYQIAALLMAIVLRGLDAGETAWLTDAMVRSGGRVDLSPVKGVKVGKHSTGGVGDKTSIVVVPLVAACGLVVPKSSGRALGHTGGTIDKLEAIPGFDVALTREAFLAQLGELGCAFVSQTGDIAPADKKLYALRDVTATVESTPLIASSIMSKKIAEGTDALVLDVKVGRGAFMKTVEDARALAAAMVAIGQRVGLRTEALLTAMDAPLGRAIGNALEVAECLDTLEGKGPPDLEALCVALAARMVLVGGAEPSLEAAERRVRGALADGSALDRLRRVIERQGGDPRVVDDRGRLPSVPCSGTVDADRDGWLGAMDAERVGRASMALGAGRNRADARIDPGAGLRLLVKPGERVSRGAPLLALHAGAGGDDGAARALLAGALTLTDAPPSPGPLVIDAIA